jgi:hypothetical protein
LEQLADECRAGDTLLGGQSINLLQEILADRQVDTDAP